MRRFAALRAAHRALAPSVRSPESLPTAQPLRAIRDQLRALLDAVDDPAGGSKAFGDADLLGIDDALDGYARQLRLVADGISIPQFRASLPEAARAQRDEVLKLLDVLIEEGEALDARLNLVDYLITLVCTARQDGRWTLVADPPTVSEGTRNRSFAAPDCEPALEAEIVGRFRTATERLGGGEDFEAVVRDMHGYKQEVAPYFFLPEVLRCIVAYNLALRIIRDREMSRARELDLEVDRETESVPPGGGPEPDAAPESAFGSPGLSAIEGALERRLSGSDPLPGAGGEIAARMDVAKLRSFEVDLFTHPNPDDLGRLKRRIIVLGFVAEKHPEIGSELAALGINPAQVEDAWVREASDRVQSTTNDLVATNAYDAARRLSDLQSRVLFGPLLAAKRQEPRERPLAASPVGPAAVAGSLDQLAKTAEAARRSPAKREAREHRFGLRPSRQRIFALATVLLLLGAGAAYRLLEKDPHGVRVLSSAQLAEISPLLVSAYRSENGRGRVFIGTLSDTWQQMQTPARRETAERVRDRLSTLGVSEVILFDGRRALQVHYVGGSNTFPGWDT